MAYNRPEPGSMVHWRFTKDGREYRFGYCTYEGSHNMVRMGRWAGDTMGGAVVNVADIDWRPYS